MESESNGAYGEFKDNSGRFTNGNPGKPKGAIVKSTAAIRNTIVAFLEVNGPKIQESFDKLKPVEKLQFITAILPYVVPKMQSIQSENNHKLSGGIFISWSEPDLHHPENKGSNGELQRIPEGLSDNS